MVRWSVVPLVRQHESKSGNTSVLKLFVYVSMLERVLGGVLGVDGVGCPCPPVRNDIVTPRHLLIGEMVYLPLHCFHVGCEFALL